MDKRKLNSYFNIWIEVINLVLIFIVLSFSLYQISVLGSESLLVKNDSANIVLGIVLIHILWFLIYIQIPVFYYIITGRKTMSEQTFKFKLIKIHWIRTCMSVVCAFIALYNLQIMTGLTLYLTGVNFIVILVFLLIITFAGIYYFNKSFYNSEIAVKYKDAKNPDAPKMIMFFLIIFFVFIILLVLIRFYL
jgi:uncharacterized membrane protein YidH (DUF202 family)